MKKKAIFSAALLAYMAVGNAANKPNVVIFFVDDYGWADLGYRNPEFKTPNT